MLLIPSEEFLPPGNHLPGIFQYHQATVLQKAGFQVGTLSIRQAVSIPMVARAALFRVAGKTPGNTLDGLTFREMWRLLADKFAHPDRFVTVEEITGIPVVRVEGFYYLPPSPRTNYIGWVRAGVAAFDEYCRRFGAPDVLHAHNSDPAGLLAHRLSRRTGIPFVVTEHSTFFARGLVPHGLYPKLRRALRAASSVAVVSPALGDLLTRQLGLEDIHFKWISNVLDEEVVHAPLAHHSGKSGNFDFLALGNLTPIKDHALLLRAFHRAFGESPEVALRIGGDGELQETLEALSVSLRIADKVEFLGRLSRLQVIDELDRCDAFVLPSRYETFGVVLIEALARGKPVVSTACAGPDAIVTPEDGTLVPVGDVGALADAMAAMRRDHAQYHGDDIRNRAILRFGPQRLAESLERLYAEALAGNA
ncbi:MAG: glycosyltransferase [Gemmatimonadaceae bacterium]